MDVKTLKKKTLKDTDTNTDTKGQASNELAERSKVDAMLRPCVEENVREVFTSEVCARLAGIGGCAQVFAEGCSLKADLRQTGQPDGCGERLARW